MRLEISRRSDLALQVLNVLHRAAAPVAGRRLADQLETSPTYLAQVMAPLIAQGWVSSRPGPNGGYVGTERLPSVSVLEVLEACEGPLIDAVCVLGGRPCGSMVCSMHHAWNHARTALRTSLAEEPVIAR